MDLLISDQKGFVDSRVVVLPQGIGVVSNIAGVSVWEREERRRRRRRRERKTYLMLIRPIPARMPIIAKNCQNSTLRRSVQPRMSIRWDRSISTLFCTKTSPGKDDDDELFDMSEDVSSMGSWPASSAAIGTEKTPPEAEEEAAAAEEDELLALIVA